MKCGGDSVEMTSNSVDDIGSQSFIPLALQQYQPNATSAASDSADLTDLDRILAPGFKVANSLRLFKEPLAQENLSLDQKLMFGGGGYYVAGAVMVLAGCIAAGFLPGLQEIGVVIVIAGAILLIGALVLICASLTIKISEMLSDSENKKESSPDK